MSIRIRRANIRDLDTLLNWGKLLWDVEKDFEKELVFNARQARNHYIKELESDNSLFLIAEQERKPIGYLYAFVKDKPYYLSNSGKYCELEVIYIEEKARGKGIAKLLVDKCLDWTKEKHAQYINAGIYAGNITSQKTLLKQGFYNYHRTLRRDIR
ncbi:MAG: GNAT family N-acetyltransferase [Patescibacteria group bacterium]